jgi:hypothetical protein
MFSVKQRVGAERGTTSRDLDRSISDNNIDRVPGIPLGNGIEILYNER